MRRALLWALAACAGSGSALAEATVEVVPVRPVAGEAVEFRVTGSAQVCWPPILVDDGVELAGEVVKLLAHTPPGPLPPGCQPGWALRFAVGALAAGSYSAEFWLDDERRGAAAFEVAAGGTRELLLRGGAIGVTATFTDPRTGASQPASSASFSRDSGSFWFFSRGNVELTVKVLDGRAINGAFWVFIASMTDVAYEVEVRRRDIVCVTEPCGSRLYRAAAGGNRNFIDTEFR